MPLKQLMEGAHLPGGSPEAHCPTILQAYVEPTADGPVLAEV